MTATAAAGEEYPEPEHDGADTPLGTAALIREIFSLFP